MLLLLSPEKKEERKKEIPSHKKPPFKWTEIVSQTA